MQVIPVMSFNNSSTNSNQINFKSATLDKSIEAFIEEQIKIGVDYVKKQNKKMPKKQVKACQNNIREGWNQAYSTLEKIAGQMSDGIEISVRQTQRKIFDMLVAKNPKTGEYTDLAALVELKGFESHYIGRDKFQWLVERINPRQVNEKLDKSAYRPRFDRRW